MKIHLVEIMWIKLFYIKNNLPTIPKERTMNKQQINDRAELFKFRHPKNQYERAWNDSLENFKYKYNTKISKKENKENRVLCRYCKKPIHIDKFAGITKGGSICSDTFCIIALAKELNSSKTQKKED